MFTGLIRHLGTLRSLNGSRLTVTCPGLRGGLKPGDSVAVNGACLTVAELNADGFTADLLSETREGTTLGRLPIGARLNLETALRTGDELGGHFVQGHVDGTVPVLMMSEVPRSGWKLTMKLTDWLKPFIVEKCSIAINGVSLTVQEFDDVSFSVSIIPTTHQETNLGGLKKGDEVNIEADMIVKTVRRALDGIVKGQGAISENLLRSMGYGSK